MMMKSFKYMLCVHIHPVLHLFSLVLNLLFFIEAQPVEGPWPATHGHIR